MQSLPFCIVDESMPSNVNYACNEHETQKGFQNANLAWVRRSGNDKDNWV